MGNDLYLYKNFAEGFSADRNSIVPIPFGGGGVVLGLPQENKGNLPETGADVGCRWIVRNLLVLSAGKHLTHWFLRGEEKLRLHFFLGFLVAIVGICLISFNGAQLAWNPKGDWLALLAAFVWACYSILTRKISAWGYPTVLITRRVFLYGILFMLPTLFFFDFRLGLERLTIPTNLVNLLFLGLGASALCFVTWNFAVKILGALKTSVYIYMVPVITVITSVLILHETITPLSGVGIGCTFVGLLLSEYKGKALSQPKQNMQV